MRLFTTLIFALCFFSGFVFAECPKANTQDQLKAEKQTDTNSWPYKNKKAALERRAKMQEIASLYKQGKIGLAQAEKRLYPLVKVNMQGYLNDLDERIKRLEKQVEVLKKTKLNPEQLIKKHIDMCLGTGGR